MFEPDFSLLDVELVLDAGELRFCEAVEEAAALPCGEVLTDSGDVRPVFFAVIETLLLPVGLLVCWGLFDPKGVVLRTGGGPPLDVLRSCGEATPVEEVESAYLQLAAGFNIAAAGL